MQTRAPGFGATAALALVLVIVPDAALGAAQTSSVPAPAVRGHRFACADHTQGKIFIIAADGAVEWEYPAPDCDDIWVLPSGNVLCNVGHSVREVARDGRVVFEYPSTSEIYACQRLPGGRTFVGECNTGRLLEIEPSGRIAWELRLLPEGKSGGHLFIRGARRVAGGRYLVAHYAEEVVREYESDGRIVRSFPAPGGPHSVVRLRNGHTVISLGDLKGGGGVVEVDRAGRTVWEVRGDELAGVSLKFVAGIQRLANGNTVLCNWLGHGQLGKAPHLIEVTRDKRVVWTYADHRTLRTAAGVQLLDQKGDAVRGGIMR
jgi:hypothetical protein